MRNEDLGSVRVTLIVGSLTLIDGSITLRDGWIPLRVGFVTVGVAIGFFEERFWRLGQAWADGELTCALMGKGRTEARATTPLAFVESHLAANAAARMGHPRWWSGSGGQTMGAPPARTWEGYAKPTYRY